jgi:CYTH domain-containing protein
MATEIERKFLVVGEEWRRTASGRRYRQGYLSTDPSRAVRVRTVGDQGFLTIKGATRGATRREYEYAIPVAEADAMLDGLCLRPLIEKVRYTVPFQGRIWEVDEFLGGNAGLVMAEVELESEGEELAMPAWIGKEVTDDPRYYNAALVHEPFSRW